MTNTASSNDQPRRLTSGPLAGSGVVRRVGPFAAVAALSLVLAPIVPGPLALDRYGFAVALTIAVLVLAVVLPWYRLPSWLQTLPPLAYLGTVALLRDSLGGWQSGYSVLVLLPIAWVALYGQRRDLYVMFLGVAATIALPVLIVGEPSYPTRDLVRAALIVAVGVVVGLTVDRLVTQIEGDADAVAASEQRFRDAFDGAPIGMALTSLDGRFQRVNQAWCDLLGYTPEQMQDVSLAAITHPDDLDASERSAAQLSDGASPSYDTEKRYLHRDGHAVWAHTHVTAVSDEAGSPVGLLAQIVDLTARRQLEDHLQHLADHDPLTGLLNRRGFDTELRRHLDHVGRYGPAGALLLFDLDGFKQVNDSLGHSVGDALMASVGRALSDRVRSTDIIGRLGGDEFAVLLPQASPMGAVAVAEAVLAAVPQAAAEFAPAGLAVTASVGIARFDRADLTVDNVLANADDAMYRAKELGRNQFVEYADRTQRGAHPSARGD